MLVLPGMLVNHWLGGKPPGGRRCKGRNHPGNETVTVRILGKRDATHIHPEQNGQDLDGKGQSAQAVWMNRLRLVSLLTAATTSSCSTSIRSSSESMPLSVSHAGGCWSRRRKQADSSAFRRLRPTRRRRICHWGN